MKMKQKRGLFKPGVIALGADGRHQFRLGHNPSLDFRMLRTKARDLLLQNLIVRLAGVARQNENHPEAFLGQLLQQVMA